MGAAMPLPADGANPNICEVGGKGLILPREYEQEWPRALRIILYAVALGWFFMGIALVADVFMGAIEAITAKKTRRWCAERKRLITVMVWNETVGNLTLMALGSSAPEILLSIIELLKNDFFSGELGPATIVGSAAFNLLMILAVCIFSVPDGDTRGVKQMGVYVTTVVASLFAYFWLLIILNWWTPNIVTVAEGLLTFAFFPVLVFVAYAVDTQMFSCNSSSGSREKELIDAFTSKDELARLEGKIQQEHGGTLTPEQVLKIIEINHTPKASRARYRVAAIRNMTGSKKVRLPKITRSFTKIAPGNEDEEACTSKMKREATVPIVEFEAAGFAVMENCGHISISVNRSGVVDKPVTVHYCTRDGDAKQQSDYEHTEGDLEFKPNELTKSFDVKIVDDESYETDEHFFVDLSLPAGESAAIGERGSLKVVIIDDDLPGIIGFPEDDLNVKQGNSDSVVLVEVKRANGATGTVTCDYATEDESALAGKDYKKAEGTLTFGPGESVKSFPLTIHGHGAYEKWELFRVILSNVTGGARFDSKTDGGEETCILSVNIEPSEDRKEMIDNLAMRCFVNWDKTKLGNANWADQFKSALQVNGGDDDDDESDTPPSPPTASDWVVHLVLLPWKLFFALIPPADYCGGWACFVVSLTAIGLVTALVGDLAGLFGCVLGLGNLITAITIVALGTSLPDTFASRTAAMKEPHADASIVNVTGSNSVNVFLGLGLPWMIAAFYWSGGANDEWEKRYEGKSFTKGISSAFVVEAGSLSFSVTVYSICAVCCIVVLFVRRLVFKGELGGPKIAKILSSALLASLWLLYIGLSIWYELK
eukprot:TRINITY_DN49936_c0_g1_i1.p1 TRINITY_DN49936_c0_g1~~TRINITY_DN49936_c0_g1_i1.p1  ORF type:complete len:825 (-),score=127.26 TRINITY_DN49936_c0_g1_i1:103-2577(-)